MKIVADEHIPFIKNYFGSFGELVLKPGRQITAHDVHDADLLIVRSITQVNASLLADSKVKFVGSVTAGSDHLDKEWLNQAGIQWHVADGFNAPPVADYVVSVIAALERKHILKNTSRSAAVIGVGHVGRLVSERLKLLGFSVLTCDPIRAANEPHFESVTLDQISDVDLVTLHTPLTRLGDHPTYHFIDRAFLQRQKAGCVLLNASRGAVINSMDLMLHGTHLHWCFDVWEHEPQIDKQILERALIASPHIAGYSAQSKIRGIDMIYQLACAEKIVSSAVLHPISMPTQTLHFAGNTHHWQDLVLGIFNPLVMTAITRATLLGAENAASLFDQLRNRFTYRHEFSATKIAGVNLTIEDTRICAKLGIDLNS